jgi:hypothetical protein
LSSAFLGGGDYEGCILNQKQDQSIPHIPGSDGVNEHEHVIVIVIVIVIEIVIEIETVSVNRV